MTFWNSWRKPKHELFDRSPFPPRLEEGENYASRLRIGMAIDWMDSLPGGQGRDELRRARRRATEIADVLTSDSSPSGTSVLFDANGHTNHDSEYGPGYHADITGHLYEDELPVAWTLYERLRGVDGKNLSALANLAELERRRGAVASARDLLAEAIERATSSTERRHGVHDTSWLPHLRCAQARLDGGSEDAAALLALANREDVFALGWKLEDMTAAGQPARILAHRAFGMATPSQQVFLHVAMRLEYAGPKPPPAAHESFERFAEVDAFLVETAFTHPKRPA